MAKRKGNLRKKLAQRMGRTAENLRTFRNPYSTGVVNRADRFKNEERQRIFESKNTKPKKTAEEKEATFSTAVENYKLLEEEQKKKRPILVDAVGFHKKVKKPDQLTSVAEARAPSGNSNSRPSCVSSSQAWKRPASKDFCIPSKKQRIPHAQKLAKYRAQDFHHHTKQLLFNL